MKTKITLVLLLLIASKGYMQTEYDPNFGDNGIYVQEGIAYGSTVDLAFQNDGKIVAMSYYQDQVTYNTLRTVYRINTDGTLDTSFGINGVFTDDAQITTHRPGKLLVYENAVYTISSPRLPGTSRREMTITKLTADGTLDTDFGAGGYSVIPEPVGTDFSDGLDLKINGNGEIIAGGITKMDDTGARRIIIAKFSANGSLVTNFGNNGVYQQEELLGFDQSFATLLINSDDSINIVINLQSGTTYYDLLAVLKLTSAGELDTSFGDNGLYSIEYSGHKPASSASSLPDGSILIYGSQMDENENYKGMSSRITKNGILDTSFGENGYGNGYDGGGEEIVNYSRMISKNDRYVLIGDVLDLNGFVRKIIVSQINHDGTFVDTYGINGSSFFESPSSDYTGIRAMNAISEGNNFYIVGEVSLPDYKINPIIAKLIDNTLEVSDFTTIMSNAKISPNPVDETTFIHFESQENRMVNLSIVNSLGQIVSSREVDMKQGANNISLMQDTQILSKGFYFVNLSMDGKNLKSFKIIK